MSIDLFRAENEEGALLATIGLMDTNQSRNPEIQIFSEVLMDSRDKDPLVANVLSTVAFYILKNGWKIAPGVVFEQMLDLYYPGHALPHVMFISPFQWKEGMSRVELGEKRIHPLAGVPISEAERRFVAENPPERLSAFGKSKTLTYSTGVAQVLSNKLVNTDAQGRPLGRYAPCAPHRGRGLHAR